MRYSLLSIGILATMSLAVSADISELFEDTLEKNSGVLNSVVNNQFADSVVKAIPASVPQQAQPVSNRLTDAQIAAINQQLAQVAAANYPQAVPASYPQALPANYPQALPAANYPQAVPASYRPVTPQNVQYIPYPVASKHEEDDEEEEDEEEEDEEEEDEEEFDADDLVTRRRRR